MGTLRHQPLGPLEPLGCGVGKGLGEHSGWPGSLCSLRAGRALKALSWPCAPAFDLFFVFLNHTAPWVKEVQPTFCSVSEHLAEGGDTGSALFSFF